MNRMYVNFITSAIRYFDLNKIDSIDLSAAAKIDDYVAAKAVEAAESTKSHIHDNKEYLNEEPSRGK